MEVYRQAVREGLAHDDGPGLLEFFTKAERALAQGDNPGALLFWLLKNKTANFVSDADEDAARKRLDAYVHGPVERSCAYDNDERPTAELSTDERIVETCIRLAKTRRGVDPFLLAKEARGWSRQRWDETRLMYLHNQSLRALYGTSDVPSGLSEHM